VDLSGANLSGVRLNEAWLAEANLSGAHLDGADFDGANLRGANLSRANLSGADLGRADLTGANLRDAIYSEDTTWPAYLDPTRQGMTFVSSHKSGSASNQEFTIAFAPELSSAQIKVALQALADYYRSCGGVGFKIDFDLVSVAVGAPVDVKR